jgi:hypothetical protein
MTANNSAGQGTNPNRRSESAAAKRNRPSRNSSVYAARYDVISRSGKRRLVLIVVCPHCRDSHAHTAPVGFASGIRKAACGGRYVLLTAKQLAVVA